MTVLSIGEYQSLTTMVFSAALQPNRWIDVLAAFSNHVPSARTQIWAQDLEKGDACVAFTHGYDPYWVDLFAQHYHAINEWAPALTTAPVGRILFANEMCSDRNLIQSEFYSDWVLPQEDLRGGGGGLLARDTDSICMFGANIPNARRALDEERWIRLMRQMMPALQQSWSINQILAKGALERALLAYSDQGDPAILLVDETGRIIFRNAPADKLISLGEAVRSDIREKLQFREPSAENRFQSLLRAVKSGPYVGASFDLPSKSTVRCARFDPDYIDEWNLALFLGVRSPSLLVVISTAAELPVADLISKKLRLTRSEAEIALSLAEGYSPRDIAANRKVSIHTVRTQIKSALAKSCSKNRTQLVATILRLSS